VIPHRVELELEMLHAGLRSVPNAVAKKQPHHIALPYRADRDVKPSRSRCTGHELMAGVTVNDTADRRGSDVAPLPGTQAVSASAGTQPLSPKTLQFISLTSIVSIVVDYSIRRVTPPR
jgi:hypothetical protein